MDVRLLVFNVANIVKTYELIKQSTGGYFNVFRIGKIDESEVAFCRFMHDLLNPKGSHYLGDTFLREFVDVVGLNFSECDYQSVQVYREYVIDNDRRIDLLIKSTRVSIPIEVKIHASDQKNQCRDYFKYARNSKLIYLTKYGDSPTSWSLGDLPVEHVLCVSFKDHVVPWIERCLSLPVVLKIGPIREVLLQFIDAIKLFTNHIGDEQMNEIEHLLSLNSETMKSALLIEQAVGSSRVHLLKKLFYSFENKIALEKMNTTKDYAANDYENLKRYYMVNVKHKKFPGLHYLYQKDVVDGCDLWFSIEIDYYLYAGFYLNGDKEKRYLENDQIKKLLPHIHAINRENLFLHWRYLPLKDEDKGPNFATAGLEENYLNLFDGEYFNQFVDDCLEGIEMLYGKSITKST